MRGIVSLTAIPVVWMLCACAAATHHPVLDDTALIARLQRGGHVIFFRHAKTNWNEPEDVIHLDDCGTQRNLSEEGRDQPREIGRALDVLGIPVGDVLTSPFCRTYDTGMLAFRRAQRVDALTGLQAASPETRARRNAALREFFSTAPTDGTNTVVIAHMLNLKGVSDVLIAEGDAAVIEPRGADGFRMIGVISSARWTELALHH